MPVCTSANDHEGIPRADLAVTNTFWRAGEFADHDDLPQCPTFLGHAQCRPEASLRGLPTAAWAARCTGSGRWCTPPNSPSWKQAERTAVRADNAYIVYSPRNTLTSVNSVQTVFVLSTHSLCESADTIFRKSSLVILTARVVSRGVQHSDLRLYPIPVLFMEKLRKAYCLQKPKRFK